MYRRVSISKRNLTQTFRLNPRHYSATLLIVDFSDHGVVEFNDSRSWVVCHDF